MNFTQVPAVQKAHSEKLEHYIQAAIEENSGWISFDEYMQLALYTPGLGYYAGGLTKFGESGDFITAPEMGDLFGQCLARQTEEILSQIPHGVILEFGAGSGALAATILDALAANGALPAEYMILELSAELRARQFETIKARVPELIDRVKWLDSLPDVFAGVVLANEVLDAMPVKLFEQDENGLVYELGVALERRSGSKESFCWKRRVADDLITDTVQALKLDYQGRCYRSELQLQANAWINSLGSVVQNGVVLLIDYGFPRSEYYHPDRNMGTLMCHYQHHSHDDPFYLPGLQDITSHIDFTAFANTAQRAGFELAAYATQAAFLLSAGLLDNIAFDLPVELQLSLSQEVKKLTMPHEMGELFKVLALSKNYPHSMSGFSQQNNVHRLNNG